MPERNENLDDEMERDTQIRRETDVRNALGPVEGTDAERNAAESALSDDERAGGEGETDVQRAAQRRAEPEPAAHVERGTHSDESMTATTEPTTARTTEKP